MSERGPYCANVPSIDVIIDFYVRVGLITFTNIVKPILITDYAELINIDNSFLICLSFDYELMKYRYLFCTVPNDESYYYKDYAKFDIVHNLICRCDKDMRESRERRLNF